MKLRFLTPIALFAILIPLLIYGLSRDPGKVPSPFIGKPAPELELPDLENPGRVVSSADYAGRYALVNVWATWCVGCRHEHEFLLTLAERGEIPIYGLNWKDEPDAARRWLRDLGDPYTATGVDADGSAGIDWGVYGAPETFLIGPDGIVLHKHVSPLTAEVWQRDFVPLIGGAKAN
jgi:cytochrome c biogenesis protein CcmG/thiol:disulfide interchange protein DsbE